MEINFITPGQAAEKWGITDRQVQSICAQGKIEGVIRIGHMWLIPKDAPKPLDGRTKEAKKSKNNKQSEE